jgi:hypothetical protein
MSLSILSEVVFAAILAIWLVRFGSAVIAPWRS